MTPRLIFVTVPRLLVLAGCAVAGHLLGLHRLKADMDLAVADHVALWETQLGTDTEERT